MQMEQRQQDAVIVVDLAGRLIHEDSGGALKDKVASLIFQGHTDIVLNLARVSHIDSAGLGELIAVRAQAGRSGARIVLANLSTRTRNLLVITRLLTAFDTYEGEGAAVASFRPAA
jgi:anti-sigma B factor antagonist